MFQELVKEYEITDDSLGYKYYHSFRVRDNMAVLAKNMNLPIKDVKIAMFIGLFHDYGRFYQYKITGGFDDKILDHADCAVDYLKKHNEVMEYYKIDKDDYDIIYKAIGNHNKYRIDDNLSKRELLFSKMIRDADKLDILYATGNNDIKTMLYEDDRDISDIVRDSFYREEIIPKEICHSYSDKIVYLFSYIFDINFGLTMEMIRYNDYYSKIYERLNNKEQFREYISYVNKYIDERND